MDESEASLEGLIKDTVHEEVHQDEVAADDLAQRMAAQQIKRLANRHGCKRGCDDPRHDKDAQAMRETLEMLGLPEVYDVPTEEEKSALAERLPKAVSLDTRNPDNILVPERRITL